MNKFILAALCIAAAGACGGGGSSIPEVVDAGPTFDAKPDIGACNPVTETGCPDGEKCTQVEEAEGLFKTTCVVDGSVAVGGACMDGAMPGPTTGFDNCMSGSYCLNGTCVEICSTAPDSCRTPDEAVGTGSYCDRYSNLFDDTTGLCVPSCNPSVDTVVGSGADQSVENTDCGMGVGCYLAAIRGAATCAGVPADAVDKTQNQDCYGPQANQCFQNGCAAGFGAEVPNLGAQATPAAEGTSCVRYCTPANTYVGSIANADGMANKCAIGSLAPIGGTNGNNALHQCRFMQTFYSNTDQTPEGVGVCVPVTTANGGIWGDCVAYDHNDFVAKYNAEDTVAGQDTVFNTFCYGAGNDPQTTPALPQCIGFFRGCISLAKQAELVDVEGAAFNVGAWAARQGIDLEKMIPGSLVQPL